MGINLGALASAMARGRSAYMTGQRAGENDRQADEARASAAWLNRQKVLGDLFLAQGKLKHEENVFGESQRHNQATEATAAEGNRIRASTKSPTEQAQALFDQLKGENPDLSDEELGDMVLQRQGRRTTPPRVAPRDPVADYKAKRDYEVAHPLPSRTSGSETPAVANLRRAAALTNVRANTAQRNVAATTRAVAPFIDPKKHGEQLGYRTYSLKDPEKAQQSLTRDSTAAVAARDSAVARQGRIQDEQGKVQDKYMQALLGDAPESEAAPNAAPIAAPEANAESPMAADFRRAAEAYQHDVANGRDPAEAQAAYQRVTHRLGQKWTPRS